MNGLRNFDLVVIGAGLAGCEAALQASKLGKTVAIVGTQLPSKLVDSTVAIALLRQAGCYRLGLRRMGHHNIAAEITSRASMDGLASRTRELCERQLQSIQDDFTYYGVQYLPGRGAFIDTHTIRVANDHDEFICRGDHIVIATGTRPARTDKIPIDNQLTFDTDGVVSLMSLPRRLTIVGAAIVGVECATIFAALGVVVTLIEKRPRFLEFADGQIVEALSHYMRSEHITVRAYEEIEGLTITENMLCLTLRSKKQVWSDAIMYAVGRQGNIEELNLRAAGLEADSLGRIAVAEDYRTKQPHIFAVGDIIGFPSLGSVGVEQARLAARTAFGYRSEASKRNFYPYLVNSIPQIGFIGKTEEELTDQGVPYEIGIAHYSETTKGRVIGDPVGMMKIIFHRETRKLLGIHVIGEGADELVHVGQIIQAYEGTLESFIDNIFNYPSLTQCYRIAAMSGLGKQPFSRPG